MDVKNQKESIHINKKLEYIIYGAGAKGVHFKEILKKSGYFVKAFFDINADTMRPFSEIPLSKPKPIEKFEDSKKTIVIISLGNVFLHKNVVQNLSRYGYQYFIYKDPFSNDDRMNLINKVFDKLYSEDLLVEGGEIAPFSCIGVDYEKNKLLLDSDNTTITCYVPSCLLFSQKISTLKQYIERSAVEFSEQLADKSILYFTYCNELFEAFNGLDAIDTWEDYWNFYVEYKEKSSFIKYNDKEQFQYEVKRHLRDRYYIYQEMERSYVLDTRFFEKNPIVVSWNTEGYFNIEDGHNRAAFLLVKNRYLLPCVMQKDDFNKWENRSQAESLKAYLKQNKISLSYPINNPLFLEESLVNESYENSRLFTVCKWLKKMKINPVNKRVLELHATSLYLSQHFIRMKADVTAVLDGDVYENVQRAINKLLYIDNMKFAKFDSCCIQEYDILILDYIDSDALRYERMYQCAEMFKGIGWFCELKFNDAIKQYICEKFQYKCQLLRTFLKNDKLIENVVFFSE